MSLALAQRLAHEPKGNLVNQLVRFKSSVAKHKEQAKHAVKLMLSSTLAAGGGATAGVLAVKMPLVPKTNIPTDIALGTALGLAAAAGLLDDLDEHANSFANGLIGAGMARVVAQAMVK